MTCVFQGTLKLNSWDSPIKVHSSEKKLRTKKPRINLTLGLDPQIPVGTEIVYGCEEDFVFGHDWYSRPTIVLTCNDAGEFDGFPGFWPACVNRKLSKF